MVPTSDGLPPLTGDGLPPLTGDGSLNSCLHTVSVVLVAAERPVVICPTLAESTETAVGHIVLVWEFAGSTDK